MLIYLWAGRLYGPAPAATCTALWFADPNVLAHSTIATTDVATTFFGLLATFLFAGYLRHPSGRSATLAGLGLGLAVGTKFTMVLLAPAWAAMAAVDAWPFRRSTARPSWRGVAGVASIPVAALLVVNLIYGFHGTGGPLGSLTFTSPTLSGSPAMRAGDLVGNRSELRERPGRGRRRGAAAVPWE